MRYHLKVGKRHKEFIISFLIANDYFSFPAFTSANNIHLLDRTETNFIFIWSGKVILGEAKPSPNITLPDQINMILGEVLSNKCFIIPATLCVPGPSHALLIQTKRPFTQLRTKGLNKSCRLTS